MIGDNSFQMTIDEAKAFVELIRKDKEWEPHLGTQMWTANVFQQMFPNLRQKSCDRLTVILVVEMAIKMWGKQDSTIKNFKVPACFDQKPVVKVNPLFTQAPKDDTITL